MIKEHTDEIFRLLSEQEYWNYVSFLKYIPTEKEKQCLSHIETSLSKETNNPIVSIKNIYTYTISSESKCVEALLMLKSFSKL